MSGLLDSLSVAARSLDAQRMGMDVVGQNLANANTAGYSRRMVLLEERPSSDAANAGHGVGVREVRAQRDQFIQTRLRQEGHATGYADAALSNLSVVQTVLGRPGKGLDGDLTAFFNAWQTLAQDSLSAPARDAVVVQGQSLARAFRGIAGQLSEAARDADRGIRAHVEEINTLASQVAALNGKIAGANGADVEALRDRRDVALNAIAGLADVSLLAKADGTLDVTIGQGRAIVSGSTARALGIGSAGASGLATLTLDGQDLTAHVHGGRLAGLIAVRDTIVPGYQAQLDQLASDVATHVNALHQTGFDANGASAGDFFVAPAGVAGAAAGFAVDASLAADSTRLAASGSGAVGDNSVAGAIAELRDARVMTGNASAHELWGGLVYRVGADIANAQATSQTHRQVSEQLTRLRDSVSGVSVDDEAAQLMKYQRAYEANARYFTTIASVIDTLMGTIR